MYSEEEKYILNLSREEFIKYYNKTVEKEVLDLPPKRTRKSIIEDNINNLISSFEYDKYYTRDDVVGIVFDWMETNPHHQYKKIKLDSLRLLNSINRILAVLGYKITIHRFTINHKPERLYKLSKE